MGMKKRAANFTSEEKSELLDAVLRHRNVLFGRSLPLLGRYWAAKKAAWCEVVDAVNKVRLSPGRNVHECRRKLKDLKAATRKKFMDVNGMWKTEVDIKLASTEELKILKLLGNDEKGDEKSNIDLSIVKVEPEVVESEAEEGKMGIVMGLDPALASKPNFTPASSAAPPIAVINCTRKVEPIKCQTEQVGALTSIENLPLNKNAVQSCSKEYNLSQAHSQVQDVKQIHNQCGDQGSSQSAGQANASVTEGHIVIQAPAPFQASDSRKRNAELTNQSRPIADFVAPVPLKRIKLFVRNVPSLSQPSTSVGPTANGNVLNFAICSCNKHPQKKNTHDIGMQTDLVDMSKIMEKIVDTQSMTAMALTEMTKIAQSAREFGLWERNINIASLYVKKEEQEIRDSDDEEEEGIDLTMLIKTLLERNMINVNKLERNLKANINHKKNDLGLKDDEIQQNDVEIFKDTKILQTIADVSLEEEEMEQGILKMEDHVKEMELRNEETNKEIEQKGEDTEQTDEEIEMKGERFELKGGGIERKGEEIELKNKKIQPKGEKIEPKDEELKQKEGNIEQGGEIGQKDEEMEQTDEEMEQTDEETEQTDEEMEQMDGEVEQTDEEVKRSYIGVEQKHEDWEQKDGGLEQKDVKFQIKEEVLDLFDDIFKMEPEDVDDKEVQTEEIQG